MGTAEDSPACDLGPRSVGGADGMVRKRRRRPLASAVTVTCVILLCHQSPLPVAASSSPSSLRLPPTVQEYHASRRARHRDERRCKFRRRRRNNTAFYYGIRDDDISCSSASLTSTRMGPMLHGDVSAPRCPTGHWEAVGDVVSEDGQICREERVHELGSDVPPPPECNHQNSAPTARAASRRFLHISAKHLQPLDRRKWSVLWERRGGIRQLERLSTSVGSLLGGGSTIMSWDGNSQNQQCQRLDGNGAIVHASTAVKQRKKPRKRRKNNTGFYYGIREDVLSSPTPDATGKRPGSVAAPPQSKGSVPGESTGSNKAKAPAEEREMPPPPPENKPARKEREKASRPKKQKPKPKKKLNGDVAPGMSDVFGETLLELREMREEIVALREELKAMKDKMKRDELGGVVVEAPPAVVEEKPMEELTPKVSKRARQRKLERIGKDVEQWAVDLLFGQEDRAGDGWKEISCNNFVKKKFNKHGRTEVYLKWMPDTRDDEDIESTSSRTQEYPCLKCYSTIDAPIDDVCSFLANEETMPLYNELVVDHAEVEEITPHSKITWTKCPKILFVKPRDFVTYCSHRWRRDGTQVLINQACEHEDRPAVLVEGQGDACRGFALRGANFISRDPDDPNKTRFTMLSHANPGGGLPQWAMNTAVNAVVQIEPFKFFHNINDSICNYQKPSTTSQTSVVRNLPGRSSKPAGIAHLGFTCFWPNGGGLKESNSLTNQQQHGDYGNEEEDEIMIGLED